jgi:8-oxo-dGTP diphosphatase
LAEERARLTETELEQQFPEVFAPRQWKDLIRIRGFTRSNELPPKELVSSVNVIAFAGDACVLVTATGLGPMIPGGTRDAGEELIDTAGRELMEEAGARLLTWQCLGWWSLHSARPEPYRPWLPHPGFLRVILLGDAEIVGPPTQPVGGEVIDRVEMLPVSDIAARFTRVGRPELADLYRLAELVRSEQAADRRL